ncbi:MAG: CDP-glucose 4,6-dehydratase [Gemmatimonadaceae bacterium]
MTHSRGPTSNNDVGPGAPAPGFWLGRRVFLTGHTGFKGSWLCLWLESLGAHVTGYALEPPTEPSLYEQADAGRGVRSIIADVRDFDRLKAAVAETRPEVILHLAAQSVVKRGYAAPIETYASNVMGTVHVFEAVRQLGLRCAIVNVTSDKCYAHRSSGPAYAEDDPMGGDDPYSNSKGCAELVTTAYRRSYFPPSRLAEHGVALASARAGNAIGGGDWTADQLIPDLIRAFTAGRPCLIRSPGGIRPWQFVLEPIRGYLMLAEQLAGQNPAFASGWNFGPRAVDAKPVSWIADRMAGSWGAGARWERDSGSHPAEAPELRLDASKAATELHWRPAMNLGTTLDWIVEWYRGWAAGEDIRTLTVGQISQYEHLLTSGLGAPHDQLQGDPIG